MVDTHLKWFAGVEKICKNRNKESKTNGELVQSLKVQRDRKNYK